VGESTGEFEVDAIDLGEDEDLVNHEEDLKSQIQDEINELDDEEVEEAAKELHPALATLKKQVPSLFKLVDLVNKKLPKKKAKKIKEEVQNEDASSAEQKPKKKFKVIHLVILLGIAFFTFEEQILGPTEEAVPVVKLKKRDRPTRPKKKPVPVEEKEKLEPTKEDPLMIGNKEEPKLDTVVEETTTKAESPAANEDKKSEDITDLFKDQMDDDTTNDAPIVEEPDIEEPVIAEPAVEESVVEDPVVEEPEETIAQPSDEDTSSDDDEKRIEDAKEVTSAPIEDDKAQDFLVDSFEDNTEDITESIMSDLEKKIKDKKDEASTMLDSNLNQAYEFTDVPDYEYVGRALVYNCTDKHWACIDVKSYTLCQKNYSYNEANSKIIQCYPKAIFEADLDCEKQQLTNVSDSISTKFCN